MTPGPLEFVLEAPAGDEPGPDLLPAVLAALSQAFTVTPEAAVPSVRRRTWLDTFDWRLYRAGLMLQFEQARRGGRLLLSRVDGTPQAEQPVTGWPPRRPALDLPPGPVRDRIMVLISPRALLPIVQGGQHGQRHAAAQRRREDRGPAGCGAHHGDRGRGQPTAAGSISVGTTAELPLRLAVATVRGYPAQARKAAGLLAGVAGVSHASQSVFIAALTALGRHPADYTSGVDAEITADDARVRRGGPAAAAPARHPGAERRRRAPGHRHRVPARPAGRRPPHPVGDQAAPRGPARRPGQALCCRVQVARRPDHADQGPRRPPARLRLDDRAAGRRVAGRPGAVPRLPGQAPRPRVPAAGHRAARAAVPRHYRRLAQDAARDP